MGKKTRGASEVAARGMASLIHRVAISTHTAAQRLTLGLPGFISIKQRTRASRRPMPKKTRAGLLMGVDAAGVNPFFSSFSASFGGASSSTIIVVSATLADIYVGVEM
jgi:hypothetical protein